jgi:uncharacterized protein (DUF433 family)
VPLDSVVHAFDAGASAEEIARKYPTLELEDAYAIIAFYSSRRDAVRAYLDERAQQERAAERRLEPMRPPRGTRERLLARRARR